MLLKENKRYKQNKLGTNLFWKLSNLYFFKFLSEISVSNGNVRPIFYLYFRESLIKSDRFHSIALETINTTDLYTSAPGHSLVKFTRQKDRKRAIQMRGAECSDNLQSYFEGHDRNDRKHLVFLDWKLKTSRIFQSKCVANESYNVRTHFKLGIYSSAWGIMAKLVSIISPFSHRGHCIGQPSKI